MIRRPPRSTRVRSSAASDVYKRQKARLGDLLRHVGCARNFGRKRFFHCDDELTHGLDRGALATFDRLQELVREPRSPVNDVHDAILWDADLMDAGPHDRL